MENYRKVTDELVQMESEMAKEARQIQKTYDDAKEECCNRFGDAIREVVKGWSKDDYNQWCKAAREDDTVSGALYHVIGDAWVLEHINGALDNAGGVTVIEISKRGQGEGTDVRKILHEILGVL